MKLFIFLPLYSLYLIVLLNNDLNDSIFFAYAIKKGITQRNIKFHPDTLYWGDDKWEKQYFKKQKQERRVEREERRKNGEENVSSDSESSENTNDNEDNESLVSCNSEENVTVGQQTEPKSSDVNCAAEPNNNLVEDTVTVTSSAVASTMTSHDRDTYISSRGRDTEVGNRIRLRAATGAGNAAATGAGNAGRRVATPALTEGRKPLAGNAGRRVATPALTEGRKPLLSAANNAGRRVATPALTEGRKPLLSAASSLANSVTSPTSESMNSKNRRKPRTRSREPVSKPSITSSKSSNDNVDESVSHVKSVTVGPKTVSTDITAGKPRNSKSDSFDNLLQEFSTEDNVPKSFLKKGGSQVPQVNRVSQRHGSKSKTNIPIHQNPAFTHNPMKLKVDNMIELERKRMKYLWRKNVEAISGFLQMIIEILIPIRKRIGGCLKSIWNIISEVIPINITWEVFTNIARLYSSNVNEACYQEIDILNRKNSGNGTYCNCEDSNEDNQVVDDINSPEHIENLPAPIIENRKVSAVIDGVSKNMLNRKSQHSSKASKKGKQRERRKENNKSENNLSAQSSNVGNGSNNNQGLGTATVSNADNDPDQDFCGLLEEAFHHANKVLFLEIQHLKRLLLFHNQLTIENVKNFFLYLLKLQMAGQMLFLEGIYNFYDKFASMIDIALTEAILSSEDLVNDFKRVGLSDKKLKAYVPKWVLCGAGFEHWKETGSLKWTDYTDKKKDSAAISQGGLSPRSKKNLSNPTFIGSKKKKVAVIGGKNNDGKISIENKYVKVDGEGKVLNGPNGNKNVDYGNFKSNIQGSSSSIDGMGTSSSPSSSSAKTTTDDANSKPDKQKRRIDENLPTSDSETSSSELENPEITESTAANKTNSIGSDENPIDSTAGNSNKICSLNSVISSITNVSNVSKTPKASPLFPPGTEIPMNTLNLISYCLKIYPHTTKTGFFKMVLLNFRVQLIIFCLLLKVFSMLQFTAFIGEVILWKGLGYWAGEDSPGRENYISIWLNKIEIDNGIMLDSYLPPVYEPYTGSKYHNSLRDAMIREDSKIKCSRKKFKESDSTGKESYINDSDDQYCGCLYDSNKDSRVTAGSYASKFGSSESSYTNYCRPIKPNPRHCRSYSNQCFSYENSYNKQYQCQPESSSNSNKNKFESDKFSNFATTNFNSIHHKNKKRRSSRILRKQSESNRNCQCKSYEAPETGSKNSIAVDKDDFYDDITTASILDPNDITADTWPFVSSYDLSRKEMDSGFHPKYSGMEEDTVDTENVLKSAWYAPSDSATLKLAEDNPIYGYINKVNTNRTSTSKSSTSKKNKEKLSKFDAFKYHKEHMKKLLNYCKKIKRLDPLCEKRIKRRESLLIYFDDINVNKKEILSDLDRHGFDGLNTFFKINSDLQLVLFPMFLREFFYDIGLGVFKIGYRILSWIGDCEYIWRKHTIAGRLMEDYLYVSRDSNGKTSTKWDLKSRRKTSLKDLIEFSLGGMIRSFKIVWYYLVQANIGDISEIIYGNSTNKGDNWKAIFNNNDTNYRSKTNTSYVASNSTSNNTVNTTVSLTPEEFLLKEFEKLGLVSENLDCQYFDEELDEKSYTNSDFSGPYEDTYDTCGKYGVKYFEKWYGNRLEFWDFYESVIRQSATTYMIFSGLLSIARHQSRNMREN